MYDDWRASGVMIGRWTNDEGYIIPESIDWLIKRVLE